MTRILTARRSRSLLAALAAAAVGAAGLVAIAAPAAADPLTWPLSGQVTIQVEGEAPRDAGLDEVMVTGYLLDETDGTATSAPEWEVTTDEFGYFEIGQVPIGRWAFEYSYRGADPNLVGGFRGGYASIDEVLYAGAFDSYDDSPTTGPEGSGFIPDFQIQLGAVASGRVTTGSSAALAGQPVALWRLDGAGSGEWEVYRQSTTNARGEYVLDALPTGTYAVRAGGAKGYVAEFWEDSYASEPVGGGDLFDLVAGTDPVAAAVHDFRLALGAKISGTVKNTSGQAVRGIEVAAYREDDFFGSGAYATVTTSSTGAYTLSALPAGTYRVGFASPSDATTFYVEQYWANKPSLEEATPITLATAASKTGVNATLARTGAITGALTLAGGGFPAASDILISACELGVGGFHLCGVEPMGWEEGEVAYDETTGAYSVSRLRAGSYVVRVLYSGTENVQDEWWNNAHAPAGAAAIAVAAGRTVTGRDIQLDPGATIGGIVRLDGTPLEGARVSVYAAEGNANTETPRGQGVTGADGRFSVTGLAAGDYLVRVEDSADGSGPVTAWQWFGGAFGRVDASVVELADAATRDDLAIDVVAGGTISGTITSAATGDGLPSYVTVVNVEYPEIRDELETFPDGTFSIGGLPPGGYRVSAEHWDFSGVTPQHLPSYLGSRTFATASNLGVTAGGTANASMTLDLGGFYTGRVVDAAGDPVENVEISVDGRPYGSWTTASDGTFRVDGLEAGPHELRFMTDRADLVRATQILETPTTLNAAAVDLGDIEIASAATISGVVRGVDGKPVRGVEVEAWVRDRSGVVGPDPRRFDRESVVTDASGRFTITQLPVGEVYLKFSSTVDARYAPQFLGGGTAWGTSDPVVLTEAGEEAFREVRLLSGGVLTGVVTNRVTGRLLGGIEVEAYPATGTPGTGGFTATNAKGVYSIPGLDAGGYDVTFARNATGTSLVGPLTSTAWVADRATTKVNAALTPLVFVRGTVRAPDGSAWDGARIRAIAVDATGSPIPTPPAAGSYDGAFTTPDGRYELALPAGRYLISVSDEYRRGASVFVGGTDGPAGATVVTVRSTAVTVPDVTLPVRGGSIDVGTITSGEGADPFGSVLLERIEGGEVVVSDFLSGRASVLRSIFPIQNVAAGEYRLTFYGYSPSGDGYFDDLVIDNIVVTDGVRTTIPTVDLGAYRDAVGALIVSVTAPTILTDGTPQVGESVTVTDGDWSTTPAAFEYQWTRDGAPIRGATADSYALTPGDAGRSIAVEVTATTVAGCGLCGPTATAEATLAGGVALGGAPIALTAPVVSGRAVAGSTVSVDRGTWDLPGLTFGFQWRRDGIDIPGATAPTFKLGTADIGREITVRVAVSRTGFASNAAVATLVGAVQPASAMAIRVAPRVTVLPTGFSVTPGTWKVAPTSVEYVWREWSVDGATATETSTGAVGTIDDAGLRARSTRVTVLVTASRAGYAPTTLEVPVRLGPVPAFTADPALVGTPRVGYDLTVDLSAAEVEPGTATYRFQWFSGATAIPGATAATFAPRPGDVGATLSVRVTATAPGHQAPSAPQLTLTAPSPVAAPDTLAAGTPVISGTAAVGRVLTASPGTWTPTPTFSYQWTRDGVAIRGATKATYRLTAADLDADVSVTVRGTRVGYTPAVASAVPVTVETLGPQSLTPPTLPPVAAVGAVLTATPGTWDIAPTSYRYQWFVNGVALEGATAATFTPRVLDLGEEISVAVVARATGYPDSAAEASASVTVMPGAAIRASAVPTLSVGGKTVKALKLGTEVAATAGTWPVAALSIRYQWQVDRGSGFVDLAGATAQTLLLDDTIGADFAVGFRYRVVVTAERAGYRDSDPVTSAALTVIP